MSIEKGWNADKIWTELPFVQLFNCSQMAVHNLIGKIKETESTDRIEGSGRPVTVKTKENGELVQFSAGRE